MSREHLKIDPEFRDKIPPLTEAEFEQLRENILADGEVYEPIVVWDGTIIDGHNRWRIICENWELLKDKYRVRQMDFADKWAAIEWMYKKQLGRRNLTEQQRELLVGKMYQARKKSNGGDRRSKDFSVVQNEPLKDKPKSTAEAIARELGIGVTTVKRSEQFAKGVDAIKEAAPAAADKILKGEVIVTKELIRSVPKMEPEAVKQLAEDIANGEPIKPKKTQEKKPEPVVGDKSGEITIKEIVADMYDPSTRPEFTLEFLLEDITANGMEYVSVLRNTLIDRSTLLTPENKPSVVGAINSIITEIQKLKELIET